MCYNRRQLGAVVLGCTGYWLGTPTDQLHVNHGRLLKIEDNLDQGHFINYYILNQPSICSFKGINAGDI